MEKCLIPRMPALIFAGILLIIAACHVAGIYPAESLAEKLPLFCPFKAITGIPCPGCGMTHAVLDLTRGDPAGALRHNPFSFFLVFMVFASLMPVEKMRRLPDWTGKLTNFLFIAVLAAVLLYWLYSRLLPLLIG